MFFFCFCTFDCILLSQNWYKLLLVVLTFLVATLDKINFLRAHNIFNLSKRQTGFFIGHVYTNVCTRYALK